MAKSNVRIQRSGSVRIPSSTSSFVQRVRPVIHSRRIHERRIRSRQPIVIGTSEEIRSAITSRMNIEGVGVYPGPPGGGVQTFPRFREQLSGSEGGQRLRLGNSRLELFLGHLSTDRESNGRVSGLHRRVTIENLFTFLTVLAFENIRLHHFREPIGLYEVVISDGFYISQNRILYWSYQRRRWRREIRYDVSCRGIGFFIVNVDNGVFQQSQFLQQVVDEIGEGVLLFLFADDRVGESELHWRQTLQR